MSNWVKVAAADDIADGEVLGIEADGKDIAVYNVEGKYYATDNVCTHAFAMLSDGFLDGCTIECPLHAGRFDIATGKALSPPVTQDIKVYPIKLDGADVLVDLG